MAKDAKLKIGLFLVIGLGLVLRFFLLERLPSFSSQEALLGWRAKSILTTGKDETGRNLPFIFSSFEGYSLPLPTYVVALSVFFLGLEKVAVRLPFVVLDTLAVFVFYRIVLFLLPGRKKVAFWSAFFLMVNPWNIYLARICSPVSLGFSLSLFGFYFLLLGLKKQKYRYFGIGFFLLAILTTKVTWFFLPPFLVFFFFYKKKFGLKAQEVLFFLIGFSLISFFYFNSSQSRLDFLNQDLNLFNQPSLRVGIDLMRGETLKFGYPFLGRFFYNKLYFVQKLLAAFFKHFNPRFYFASGDMLPNHGLTNIGPILFPFLPLTLLGILAVWERKRNLFIFLTFWFLLSIIPSSLVFPSPNLEKAIFALPVLAIFGGFFIASLRQKYLVLFLVFLGLFFSFCLYDAVYKEPLRFQEERQVGYRELSSFIKENFDKYEKIYLTDAYGSDPGPALLFYLDYPASRFLEDKKGDLYYRNFIDRIDKVLIDHQNSWQQSQKALYIVTPEEKDLVSYMGFLPFGKIDNPSGEPIFLVYIFDEKNE